MWINTKEFSPVANGSEKCDAHPLSLEMREWFKTQMIRIRDGYSVGGQYITGDMYFWLNFYQLVGKKTKKYTYPTFFDFQADFCNQVQIAREQNKGIVCVKRRQAGFSELTASIIIRELWFNDAPQILMATDGEKQIEPLIRNTNNFINVLNQSVFKKSLRVNTAKFKKMGYQTKGDDTWKGQSGELHALNFTKGNHMVSVGKVPSMLIIDEAGKADGLIDFYEYTRPAMTDIDGTMTALPIVFGATGEMEKSKDLKLMFYEPEKYNMLSFEYEGEREKVGYFVQGWRMWNVDENGNSNKEKGLDFINEQREKAKSNRDERALLSAISQYPLTPAEAFLDNGVNIFNSYKIKEQIEVIAKNVVNYRKGDIDYIDGKWDFIDNEKGRFLMYEEPEKVNDKIPTEMYIGGADPIHQEEGTSMGAIYVFKRFNEQSQTSGDKLVLEYLHRPSNPTAFAEDCLKASYYYNAVMMIEPTTYVIKDYFFTKSELHRLAKVPRIVTNDLSKGNQIKYGFPINGSTKPYVISLIAKYIDDNVSNIYFLRLLNEMLNYNSEGNFDLIMAFGQVLAYRADLWDWKPYKTKQESNFVLPKWKYINGKKIRIQ